MGAFDTIKQTFLDMQPDDGIDGGWSVEDYKPTGDNGDEITPAEAPKYDSNVRAALADKALGQTGEAA